MRYRFTPVAQLSKLEIADLYALSVQNGVAPVVFYDGGIRCWQDWVTFVRQCRAFLVRAEHPDTGTCGFFWINGYQGRAGQFHFCIWSLNSEERVELGRQTLAWVSRTNLFDSVYGCTPKVYRHVFPYIKKLGFRLLGEVPGACFIQRKNKHYPGVVSVLDLKEVYK